MGCSINTTCPYCGVGCGVTAEINDQQVVAVRGDAKHPANFGKLCVKGTALHETLGEHGRLLQPEVDGAETSWDQALNHVASRFHQLIEKHGPESIAFYLSGQLLTEDYYVANKLAKGFIKTPHVDTNSRLCMSSAVAGYKKTLGADVVPCDYTDLDHCQLLVLVGSNAAWTHPVLYRRMAETKANNPKLRVVLIDPRRTATADIADLHLSPISGSDHWLFNGLLHQLIKQDKVDHDYIEQNVDGFAQAKAAAELCDLSTVATATGLPREQLDTFFQWFCETEKTVTFYSQGVNQSEFGTQNNVSIINCHLATGRIGKPGCGPFSITGQPNAMGGREVGGLANQLAAHMDYSPENNQLLAEFWQVDEICDGPGYKAVELFDAIDRGEIKAVWIMATNPVVSMPDADKVARALEKCELVIVSDCYTNTDTGQYADVLFPATGWSEKNGTVTNSERRISRQRQLAPAPGQAKHDWWILAQVASRMGFANGFNYQSPHQVFVEHAQLSGYKNTGRRAFNISGLSTLTAQEYDNLKPVQWPVIAGASQSERLFSDGRYFTANGRAAMQPIELSPQPNTTEGFRLNTGRLRDQWHTMTRTSRASRLLDHQSFPVVYIHPKVGKQIAADEGDLIEIASAKGVVYGSVMFDDGLQFYQVFMPIHWTDAFALQARVDALVPSITDPVSGQPAFKNVPVQIQKKDYTAVASLLTREPLTAQELTKMGCWSMVPVEQDAWLYRVFLTSQESIDSLLQRYQSQGLQVCHYQNELNGDQRLLVYSDGKIDAGLFVAKKSLVLPQKQWLQSLLTLTFEGSPWRLLAGKDHDEIDLGPIICACFGVHKNTILETVVQGCDSAKRLGAALNCGTNCGSCIPELNSLIASCSERAEV